jgi:tetratricopeptide (TPR) repeat protein
MCRRELSLCTAAFTRHLASVETDCSFLAVGSAMRETAMSRTSAITAIFAMLLAAALTGCAPLHQGAAESAFAQGRFDEAANDVQAALASDPDNLQLKELAAKIFTQRGVKYYQGGQMLAAGDDFHRAVGYNTTYAPPYDYLGMIAFQQHNWQDAISYGNKAAGLEGKPDPGYVEQARKELLKVQSGGFRPYLPPGRRPPVNFAPTN